MKKMVIIATILTVILAMGCGKEEPAKPAASRPAPPEKLSLKAGAALDANAAKQPPARQGADRSMAQKETAPNDAMTETESSGTNARQPMKDLIQPNEMQRPFKGTDHSGNTISLENYKGKYVLLDFWASWCKPCHQELSYFQKIAEKYRENDKFALVGISLDRGEKPFQDYITSNKIGWPNILNQGRNDIAALYGIRTIPFTVLINPEGMVVETKLRGDGMLKAVEKHLGS